MKLKALILISLLFLSAGQLLAQQTDNLDEINIKELSHEDALRLLGESYRAKAFKTNAGETRHIKESIISGNKITTVVFNYSSICRPSYLTQVADLVWNGLGYGFEFGPLAAAKVVNKDGNYVYPVDDGFILGTQGDYNPNDALEKWGWLPKNGYVDTTQDEIATLNASDEDGDGKPDSWPERWYLPGAGKYVWPAFLGDEVTAPSEEVYFVVDDYSNADPEFNYYPFPSDSTKRGLGLDMECRYLQFNDPLAEDIIFLVYDVTNVSEKQLDSVYFGMHGDPHVGGSSDYSDDLAGFVDNEGNSTQPGLDFTPRSRNMVFCWDDGYVGVGGRRPGIFGWKFLESPSEEEDGVDNDVDGIVDESPFNTAGTYIDGVNIPLTSGINDLEEYTALYGEPKARFAGDEDGDWDPDRDDIGIDGIGPSSPNYPGPDYGEDDGVPSQAFYMDSNGNDDYDDGEPISDERLPGYKWAGSEPMFGVRDISESDQIGLTSFHAAQYTQSEPNVPKNDPLMWQWLSADSISFGQALIENAGDNVFNFGTGPSVLEIGEKQRFSMAILFGSNFDDLILNSETATKILEADYRFAQPPTKPLVNVTVKDDRVTLYWDTRSESSVDPFTGEADFLGYKIYRSLDPTFSDVYSITDAAGNPFLGKAYTNDATGEQAIWHLSLTEDEQRRYANGYHPVEIPGRAIKYYIGSTSNNDGVVHEWTDSSVTKGVTYYYAVVAFDRGSLVTGATLPPSETQAVIKRDPISGILEFDDNTVEATPGDLAEGIRPADAGANGIPVRAIGNSTGNVSIKVFEDMKVVDDKVYAVEFYDDPNDNTDQPVYSLLDSTGVSVQIVSNDTIFVDLGNANIKEGTVEVRDASGTLLNENDYAIKYKDGSIRGAYENAMPKDAVYNVSYSYYPVKDSRNYENSDANNSFDGMRLYVSDEVLDLDTTRSGFSNSDITVNAFLTDKPIAGQAAGDYRADWEIRWVGAEKNDDGTWANIGDTLMNTSMQPVLCPFSVQIVTPIDEKANVFIFENAATANGQYDWGEYVLILPQEATGARISYQVQFRIDSTLSEQVLPEDGDIYHVKTNKPFIPGDYYTFQTDAAEYTPTAEAVDMDEIYVVPNPYVAYSGYESPGLTTDKRGDRELQFHNLPQTCTIRIYTITGDLVDTIHKDDNTSIARWNLLSKNGQRIAYGVYIFHVDIPGVGEKLGRFAVIK